MKCHAFTAALAVAATSLVAATSSQQSDITPALNTPFPLPLPANQTAQAVLLPTSGDALYLVYATQQAKLGLYLLTPIGPSPTPTPDPAPPLPPGPEPGTPPQIVLTVITESTPAPLADVIAQELHAVDGTYQAFTLTIVAQPNPDPNGLLWIGLTAGKPYPYAFISTRAGQILWQGQQPQTPEDLLKILRNLPTPPPARPKTVPPACSCTKGTCP